MGNRQAEEIKECVKKLNELCREMDCQPACPYSIYDRNYFMYCKLQGRPKIWERDRL